jgi:hypothetical protein
MLVNHAEDLANVVQKALLLCEVAALARQCELLSVDSGKVKSAPSVCKFGMTKEAFDGIVNRHAQLDDDSASGGGGSAQNDSMYHGGLIIEPGDSNHRLGILGQSQRTKINELLGAWCVFVSGWPVYPESFYLTNAPIGLLIAGRNQKMKLVAR